MSSKTIFEALTAAGLTREGACALMGNMRAESGMKSNIAQRGMTTLSDEQYTASADNGLLDFVRDAVGYGLCQWTDPVRKAALLAFARNTGVSVGDEAMQVQFCLKELRESYGKVFAMLCGSHDLLACVQAVCVHYERPAHNNVGTRHEFALGFLNEIDAARSGGSLSPSDACPLFPPDPSVAVIQMVMIYNGYWEKADGYKSPEFFEALRHFVRDMEAC